MDEITNLKKQERNLNDMWSTMFEILAEPLDIHSIIKKSIFLPFVNFIGNIVNFGATLVVEVAVRSVQHRVELVTQDITAVKRT